MVTVEIHPDAIAAIVHGYHGAPFDVLGPHKIDENTVSFRAYCPTAQKLTLLLGNQRIPMNRLWDEGFFEITVETSWPGPHYQLEAEVHFASHKRTDVFADPYAFPAFLSDFDLYLLGEGRHLTSYEKLGAHLVEIEGIAGVHFAVWAPNAYRISVIGDFNGWNETSHPMQRHGVSGIWELFIPGLKEGETYKFDLRSRFDDFHVQKADPYAFAAEVRPKTASVVTNLEDYEWQDNTWLESRAKSDPLKQPISIYEVHLGSWRRKEGNEWLTYRELANSLVQYVKEMGYTHIELMPVAEHPFDGSWGYQVTGYFAPTARYGSPTDFMYLVDQCHQNNIGVILDWVPAHFPKDGHGLAYFDGTHLYEHADTRKGEHPDWGTLIFNFGRNEVRNFLLSNAIFWLKKYHIDGLRVDAVSSMLYLDFSRQTGQWLPNQYGGRENIEAIHFLREVNEIVHSESPGVLMIAEESTAWPMVSRPTYIGGLGFTFKWNMGWMHDTLDYIQKDPVYRRYAHNRITFSLFYAFSENFVLSLSHDEVVHGKGSLINKASGDWWQKFATVRLLAGYQYTHPGKKLNFMGQEIGQWREWSEERSLDWHLLELPTHAHLNQWMRDLNTFYKSQPALYQNDFSHEGFRWIEPNDADQSVYSYIRFADDKSDFIVVACNFTPIPRYHYRIGVPEAGHYKEVLNSDAGIYGGGNIGNYGGVTSEEMTSHGFPHSLTLTLPPLGIVVFKLERTKPQVAKRPASKPSKSRPPKGKLE